MSLFNTLRTSVSGLNAQSTALSTIGDNIANSSTTGYKQASAQFETLIGNEATNGYESGGVLTDIRYGVGAQGTLDTSTSPTDLAIKGNGFFAVSNGGTGTFLTRAGSFVPDSNGNLINAAGYKLEGQKILPNGTVDQNLSVVNIHADKLQAAPSTRATLTLNFPSAAPAIPTTGNTTPGSLVVTQAVDPTSGTPATGTTPAVPATPGSPAMFGTATTPSTNKTSITVYDDLGTANVLDIYVTKTDTSKWEVAAYKQSDAAPGGGFPYTGADARVGTGSLTFDPTTGNITGASIIPITLGSSPGSTTTNPINLDFTGTTQLASGFDVTKATADGNAPSTLSSVKIGTDGTLTALYASGVQIALYNIPVATVISPDTLTAYNGNVYQTNSKSGEIILESSGNNGAGTILSGELEESTVDLATELTGMITAQRAYEANSKVLQAASDLLSTLNHLQIN